MKCNQCDYLYINGIGCHETGCPNIKRKLECFYCGYEIPEDGCNCMEEISIMEVA